MELAQKGVQIITVEPGSLAEEAGIRPGDTLLKIHGEAVLDQLSYQYLITREDEAELVLQRPDGSTFGAFVENGGEGIGVDLAQDEVKVCKQNCVFCFVHQMPKGFRKSLYLKDEDIRLSFLYGHFTTLSSSDDAELDRIVRERLSPIHVSVHATDPVARVKVVGNPREGDILRKIDRLLGGDQRIGLDQDVPRAALLHHDLLAAAFVDQLDDVIAARAGDDAAVLAHLHGADRVGEQ